MVILRKPVARLTESALDRFVARARRAAGLPGTVNVLVTTSRELRLLNRRFRGQDKPTDVLSFSPAFADKNFAGDLAISAEIAARNARELGHPPATEIKILALHGVLHLAGYDHETDNGRMARREQKLRKQLRLPVALIERADAAENEKTAIAPASRRRSGGRPRPPRTGIRTQTVHGRSRSLVAESEEAISRRLSQSLKLRRQPSSSSIHPTRRRLR